tara:strand:+ start:230 stop:502 length:273 start_codon:yes stop_codon:yes gene_type:complete
MGLILYFQPLHLMEVVLEEMVAVVMMDMMVALAEGLERTQTAVLQQRGKVMMAEIPPMTTVEAEAVAHLRLGKQVLTFLVVMVVMDFQMI